MYKISDNTAFILKRLTEAGFDAYVVGGYVRDMLMKKVPHDEDITTSATPEQTEMLFSDFNVIETGLKHGTVTVIIDHIPYEITTFRTESTYSDGRHPDNVSFTTSIEEDLSRRDFTINSIAFNPEKGLVDPFGGRQDIENFVLRCVGTAKERFTEDSLRILRGLRFASVLGFSIESETKKAMFECAPLLKNISYERIFVEIVKMLQGKNIRRILVDYIDVLSFVLPEIKDMKNFQQHNFHHIYDVLEHTAAVLENTPNIPHLRLAALFHDCGKTDCLSFDENGVGHFYSHATISTKKARTALARLRCDTATKDKALKLISIHDTPIEPTERIIKRRLRSLGEDMFFYLIALQRADNLAQNPEYFYRQKTFDEIEEIAKKIIAEEQCFSLKNLAVNGRDFYDMGIRGKDIGSALDMLLEAVIDGKVENKKALLIQYYKKNV